MNKFVIIIVPLSIVLLSISYSCSHNTSEQPQNTVIIPPSETPVNPTTSTPSITPSTNTISDILPSGTIFPTPPKTSGLEASYIPFSSCSPLVQIAIQKKELPKDKIHSYREQTTQIDTGESITVVTISYGQLHDWDIYDIYLGVFINGQEHLVDLPDVNIYNAMWGRPPLNILRTQSLSNYSSNAYQTIALRSGHYGWIYKFENISFIVTSYNDAEKKLIKQQYLWSGELFVYFNSDNEVVWDESKRKISVSTIG